VISWGLMICSAKTLSKVYENEPDIYTVDDLKMRFIFIDSCEQKLFASISGPLAQTHPDN